MKTSLDVFCEIPCLTEKSPNLSGIALQKKWFKAADKRIIGQYLQKFVNYNSGYLEFLGVSPFITGSDQNISIYFRTSNFIGSIPLRAPDTGKQIGDFVVTPKFTGQDRYADYIKIVNLLRQQLNPETIYSIPLASGRNFQPPLYLEAYKFINLLDELLRSQWRKFSRIEKTLFEPKGQVNWDKYILQEYKAENRLRFPSGHNRLSELHKEFSQIRFVFDICKGELLSSNTPFDVKLSVKFKLQYLEECFYFHVPQSTKEIQIRFSDSPIVRNCKEQANKILNSQLAESTAWRVDFADVFEKFTQYIFREAAKEVGGRLLTNYRFKGYTERHSTWELRHLEPDAIFQKNELVIFIDAKYKSHLFNKWDHCDILRDEHRHDLHQILGYNSFNTALIKYGFLCYPSAQIEQNAIKYLNPVNQTANKIIILGFPLTVDSIHRTKQVLATILAIIEKDTVEYSKSLKANAA
jgi:hypothetical protein